MRLRKKEWAPFLNQMITTEYTSNSAPLTPAPILAAIERAHRAAWWSYIATCCAGRRTQARDTAVPTSPVVPGMQLEATDRAYWVALNGAWHRVNRGTVLPAHKSQIRLLPRPSKNKYSPREQEHQTPTC